MTEVQQVAQADGPKRVEQWPSVALLLGPIGHKGALEEADLYGASRGVNFGHEGAAHRLG